MKTDVYIKIELKESEALALRKVLGQQSDIDYKEKYNLNSEEMSTCHNLYDAMCEIEKEEE